MRKLSRKERDLIEFMLSKESLDVAFSNELHSILVEDAGDSGMGGLVFHKDVKDRRLGKDIASLQFKDLDGVDVMVTLSLDNFGNLYELDVWKADFSPLISLPDVERLS